MNKMFYDGDVIVIIENKLYINGDFEEYVYSTTEAWNVLESYYGTNQCFISLNSSGVLIV